MPSAEALFTQYVERLRRGTDAGMTLLRDVVQESLNTAYPPASVAGEPPHRRTGQLQRGVTITPARVEGLSLRAAVGVDLALVPYAADLELGFVGSDAAGKTHHLAPRPFLRPAFSATKDRKSVV